MERKSGTVRSGKGQFRRTAECYLPSTASVKRQSPTGTKKYPEEAGLLLKKQDGREALLEEQKQVCRLWIRRAREEFSECVHPRTPAAKAAFKHRQEILDMNFTQPSETQNRKRRVVLKISGDGFTRPGERGIVMDSVLHLAEQIARAAQNTQIAVVLGGGNILRGAQFTAASRGIREATAHYMGMLATVINGLALQDALEELGCETRLMTAIRMEGVAEPYIRRRAWRHLEKGRVVLLGAGTGRPFVTTDTAAAQWALELEADLLLKATRVDGVYSEDPERNPQAAFYPAISYEDYLRQNLAVLDREAVTKCMQYRMPIRVFNFRREGYLERAIAGEEVGTLIGPLNN
jgi:uridylate kinase